MNTVIFVNIFRYQIPEEERVEPRLYNALEVTLLIETHTYYKEGTLPSQMIPPLLPRFTFDGIFLNMMIQTFAVHQNAIVIDTNHIE